MLINGLDNVKTYFKGINCENNNTQQNPVNAKRAAQIIDEPSICINNPACCYPANYYSLNISPVSCDDIPVSNMVDRCDALEYYYSSNEVGFDEQFLCSASDAEDCNAVLVISKDKALKISEQETIKNLKDGESLQLVEKISDGLNKPVNCAIAEIINNSGSLYIKRVSNSQEAGFIKFRYGHRLPKIKLCFEDIENIKRPDDGSVLNEYYTNQSVLDEMKTSGIRLEKNTEYPADDFDLIILPGTDNLTAIDLNGQKKIQELQPNESLIMGRNGDIGFGNPSIERVVSGEHLIVRKDKNGKIYIKDVSRNGTRAIKKGFSISNGNHTEYCFRRQ